MGDEHGNLTKAGLLELVVAATPGVEVEHRPLSFGGDMRDVVVSARKICDRLGFTARISEQSGIDELRDAITSGLIKEPPSPRFRNHCLTVQ